jgi:SET domain-containing protein
MIRVGESPGRGRGIFAARDIPAGEIIEEAPVVVVPRDQVTHLDATVLGDYYFMWGVDEKEAALFLGMCSLCNHSYEPNARFDLNPTRQTITFTALHDIPAGAEITTNYNGDPANRKEVWFATV